MSFGAVVSIVLFGLEVIALLVAVRASSSSVRLRARLFVFLFVVALLFNSFVSHL